MDTPPPLTKEQILHSLAPEELQQLADHQRFLRGICLFWSLMGGMLLLVGIPLLIMGELAKLLQDWSMIAALSMGLFFSLCALCLIFRPVWGRKVVPVGFALMLPMVPVGTILGITGFLSMKSFRYLFGPGRFSRKEVKQELERRRTLPASPFQA